MSYIPPLFTHSFRTAPSLVRLQTPQKSLTKDTNSRFVFSCLPNFITALMNHSLSSFLTGTVVLSYTILGCLMTLG